MSMYTVFNNSVDSALGVMGRTDIIYRPLNDANNDITITGIFKKRRFEMDFGTATKESFKYTLRCSKTDVSTPSKSDRFIVDDIGYSVLNINDNGTNMLEFELEKV